MRKRSDLARNVSSATISAAIGAASSGIFWIIASHRFSVERIGDAGGVISLGAVVNVVTSLGFVGAAVRNSASKSGDSGLLLLGTTLSSALSLLGSVAVVALISLSSANLHFSLSASALLLVLALTSVSSAIGTITDVVGGPLGVPWLGPSRNAVSGVARLVLIGLIPTRDGALGLALVFAIPMLVTAILAVGTLTIKTRISQNVFMPSAAQTRAYFAYAVKSLPSGIVLTLIPVAAPVLAVWLIGSASGGVFYISWNGFVLANLLVASATALGVSREVDRDHLIQTVRRISVTCSTLMLLGGPVFLLLYGDEYLRQGWIAIILLSLSLFPYGQEQLNITILRRVQAHGHTTRIAFMIGLVGILGIALGSLTNAVWGMAGGWFVATTLLLIIGSSVPEFSSIARWLPRMPRLNAGAE